jgi:hypothetical protein
MSLLQFATAYYKKAYSLDTKIPLSSNKNLKDIITYVKNFLDGASSTKNYSWYYNNFSSLYEYVTNQGKIPEKILDNKYKRLLSFINTMLTNDKVSLQDLLMLGTLWDGWSISNILALRDDRVRLVNRLIKRAIEIIPK